MRCGQTDKLAQAKSQRGGHDHKVLRGAFTQHIVERADLELQEQHGRQETKKASMEMAQWTHCFICFSVPYFNK